MGPRAGRESVEGSGPWAATWLTVGVLGHIVPTERADPYLKDIRGKSYIYERQISRKVHLAIRFDYRIV